MRHRPELSRLLVDPGRPEDCAWLNESLEHHLLKLELATAIRDAGWHAELEVRAPDGSWRADVLASAHDGSWRVAFEAQLSPITDDDITARTGRYHADGVDVWGSSRRSWPGSRTARHPGPSATTSPASITLRAPGASSAWN